MERKLTRGAALVSALLMLVLLAVLAGALATLAAGGSRNRLDAIESAQALAVAEAGAAWAYKSGSTGVKAFGPGSFTVIDNGDGTLRSTGTVGAASRAVRVASAAGAAARSVVFAGGDMKLHVRHFVSGTLVPDDLSPYVTAGKILTLALGDVDGDGNVDVVAGLDNGALEVRRNVGASDLALVQQSALGAGKPRSTALGDLDGDGDLDAAIGTDVNTIEVWKNDGAGTFTLFGTKAIPNIPAHVAIGDVNLDGIHDVVAGVLNKKFHVFINVAGVLTEHPKSPHFVKNDPAFLRLADSDGDGDLDVYTGSLNQIEIHRNKGPGAAAGDFELLGTQKFATAAGLLAGDVGDVTGDGLVDLAVSTAAPALELWRGSPTVPMLLQNPGDTTATPGSGVAVAVGDLSGDGLADVVVGLTGQKLRVYLAAGGGLDGGTDHALAADPTAVAIGDLGGP